MAFMGVIGVLLGFIFCVCFILVGIIKTISNFNIFKKLGARSWKALIPIYNVYTKFRLVGINKTITCLTIISILIILYISSFIFIDVNRFMTILVLSIMGIFANWKVVETNEIILAVVLVLSFWIIILGNIYCEYKLSKKFEKGILFTIIIIIFPWICYPIIAFSKKEKKEF